MTTIVELAEDRVVEGVFGVARKQRLRTKGGTPYLALELVDPSGRIDARVWQDVELLDTAFVADLIGSAHVAYTPRAEEAVAAVDRGEAEAAFLLRPTRIEDVFAVAERGETMPQKSTYFYPKLVSGLLFHPL